MAFVELGSTNREEVLLNLGAPDFVEGDESVFTYSWSTKAGILVFGIFKDSIRTKPISAKLHRLRIEFDENGIIKNYGIEQEELDTEWEVL